MFGVLENKTKFQTSRLCEVQILKKFLANFLNFQRISENLKNIFADFFLWINDRKGERDPVDPVEMLAHRKRNPKLLYRDV